MESAELMQGYGISKADLLGIIGKVIKEDIDDIEVLHVEEKMLEDANKYAIFDVMVASKTTKYPIKLGVSLGMGIDCNALRLGDYFTDMLPEIKKEYESQDKNGSFGPIASEIEKESGSFVDIYGSDLSGWYIEAGAKFYYNRSRSVSIADTLAFNGLSAIIESAIQNAMLIFKDGEIHHKIIETGVSEEIVKLCKNIMLNVPSHVINFSASSVNIEDRQKLFASSLLIFEMIAAVDITQRNIAATAGLMKEAYSEFNDMMARAQRDKDLPGYQ